MCSEGEEVRPLSRDKSSWLPKSMTCRDLDPRQDRLTTSLGMLQRRGELVTVQWHNSIVMIAGEHQGCRIAGSATDVV